MRIQFGSVRSQEDAVKFLRSVFYGWWLVGVALFMLTLMALTVFQGLGTFLVALERQFGWSRTTLSGAFAFARVQNAVIGPVEGFLVDRVGNRRMVLIGFSIMGLGFILLSQIQTAWQFYLAFIVITIGSGLGGFLAHISMVNNWFVRQRSLAMATAMTGIHLGGFLVPILALGIESHGFRVTTMGIGIFLLIIVFPVTRLIRNRPEEYGLRPDGDPLKPERVATEDGGAKSLIDDESEFTARQALRTRVFWTLTIVHLSSSVSIVSLALHLAPKLTDMGMSLTSAGIVVLTYTAIAIPTQFVAGYLADRMPKPPLIFVFLMLQSSAMVIIAIAQNVPMAYLFAVLWGIGFGGRVPLLTAIRGDYFGRKAFATIMGLSQFPNNIAMIGAPLFAGYMFDTTGSYFVPFITFAALSFLGAALILFVKKPRLMPASQGHAA
jgi:MFS family permease